MDRARTVPPVGLKPTLGGFSVRHTYASLSRRAGADLRLLQMAMGHASITVTAHTYADLFDDELDNIAAALDSLDDLSQSGHLKRHAHGGSSFWPPRQA